MKAAVARRRNKGYYRVLHVPLWIWVFFILPGGLTEALYAHGPDRRHVLWLGAVAAVCVWRGARGRLPGTEPAPYITHYGLLWPNLPYRVVCYTAAWIAILVPWALNLAGLGFAVVTGQWNMAGLYGLPYDVLALLVVAATALDILPRTRRSIYGEGAERAWFYIAVWTAVVTQAAGWAMWRLGSALGLAGPALSRTRLAVFVAATLLVLAAGLAGRLPRTRRYHAARVQGPLRAAAGE